MDFDFQKVEQLAFDYVIDCVTQIHQQHSDEQIYTAMFHAFYGDGEDIYFPPVSVGTKELLDRVVDKYRQNPNYADECDERLRDALCWSGADLAEYMFDESEMFAHCSELTQEVTDFAQAYSGCHFGENDDENDGELAAQARWDSVYDEFLACFPRACRRATQYLLKTDMVLRDFIAFANDEAMLLVKPSLSDEQLKKHFPDLL